MSEFECEHEDRKERTQDRQMWTKKLERCAKEKYPDDRMKEEAMKELRVWEGEPKMQRGTGVWSSRWTMLILMQSRASFSEGKAVGVDDVSSENIEALLWRSV